MNKVWCQGCVRAFPSPAKTPTIDYGGRHQTTTRSWTAKAYAPTSQFMQHLKGCLCLDTALRDEILWIYGVPYLG